MSKTVKRLAQAYKGINRTHEYKLSDAIVLVKKGAKANFDETIDIAMNLGIDPRQSDQIVRGVVSLPYGTGKLTRVAVFAKDTKAQEALQSGAEIVGTDDLIETIKKGNFNYDSVIATPDMMDMVGTVGKILGPKGLMPSIKLGTVTTDIAKAVSEIKSGKIQFRNDKNGIVHTAIAKASFIDQHIIVNAQKFISEIIRVKPSNAKGTYVKRITLSSTMGVGVKVLLESIK